MFLKLQIKYVIRFQITRNMSSATSNKPAWTPGDEPSQKDLNLLNQRVIQFTDTEDTTLDVWLQLENANLDEEAAKFLNAGLLFEHYLSQLPNDPAQRSSEQVEQLETYRRDFETALDEAQCPLQRLELTQDRSRPVSLPLPPKPSPSRDGSTSSSTPTQLSPLVVSLEDSPTGSQPSQGYSRVSL